MPRSRNSGRAVRLVAVALVVGFAATGQAELVTNGSFTAGFAGWNLPGAPPAVYTVVTSSRDGSNAARVSARAQAGDAPRNNVTATLTAAGTGTTFTTRCWLKLDEPASVRALLTVVDGGGTRREQLAERVVRLPGVWLELRGTHTVAWTGTLTNAVVAFEVERFGEAVLPSFEVDEVSVEIDRDGDGLTDPEESAFNSDPLRADTDADGLLDAWEWAHAFDPRVDDALLDPDGDLYPNFEEQAAATDPNTTLSFPGHAVNPWVGDGARNVLRYLALIPSTPATCVVIGQHLSYPAPPNDEYATFIDGLNTVTGKYPGLLATQYDDGANPVQVAAVNPYAIAYWGAGGLVQIKWSPRNPWTVGFQGDRTFTSFAEVITPGNLAYDNFRADLTVVGDGLAELQAAGVTVLFRFASEMNGGWFWWGARDRQGYIDWWRYIFNYLAGERGLDNLLFVYEGDAGVHGNVPADYYYPGDDVVDVMGHNSYDDDWLPSFDLDRLFRQYPKVYAAPQAGSQNTRDGSWDNLIYLDGVPAGSGGVRHAFPRMSWIGPWNSFWTWDPVLMLSVYKSIAIVDDQNAFALMNDPCVVTRDEVDHTCPLPPGDLVLYMTRAGTGFNATWSDTPTAVDYLVLEDIQKAGRFGALTGSAASGTPGLTVPSPPPADQYFRLAGRNRCGLGRH